MITQEELKTVLSYNEETGEFHWIVSRRGVKRERRAGTIGKDGYWIIMIDHKNYYASNLAWLYMTGIWPTVDIEHKDRVRNNDRWNNLRRATRSQNNMNTGIRSDNKSGFKGVCLHKSGKWRASIRVYKKWKHLGLFNSQEEAAKAYRDYAKSCYGEFAE